SACRSQRVPDTTSPHRSLPPQEQRRSVGPPRRFWESPGARPISGSLRTRSLLLPKHLGRFYGPASSFPGRRRSCTYGQVCPPRAGLNGPRCAMSFTKPADSLSPDPGGSVSSREGSEIDCLSFAWLQTMLRTAMEQVMAGEATPLQKASTIARLGNL